MKYSEYQHLLFEQKGDGILLITINRPEVLNATNNRLHWELSRVWLDIADDDETNVIVVTGAGRAFGRRRPRDDSEYGGERGEYRQGVEGSRRHRLQHDQSRQADHLGDQRRRGRRGIGGRVHGGYQHRVGGDANHGRSPAARRRGGRSRGYRMAPAVRHGQGQVLPDDGGFYRRQGGRAHRVGEPVRPGRQADGQGDGSCAQAGARAAAGGAIHETLAQQLAARRRAGVRRIAGARDDGIFQRRFVGGRRRVAGETPAVVPGFQ